MNTQKGYIYVRADVFPADPKRADLFNSIVEKVTGAPQPDVINALDPGCIEFTHVWVTAESDEEAYKKGFEQAEPSRAGAVSNDYVIELQ